MYYLSQLFNPFSNCGKVDTSFSSYKYSPDDLLSSGLYLSVPYFFIGLSGDKKSGTTRNYHEKKVGACLPSQKSLFFFNPPLFGRFLKK